MKESEDGAWSEDEELGDGDILFEHHRISVDKGQQMLRIDRFLMERIPNTSRNKLQVAARSGHIKVNGLPVKQNYRVKPMDIITMELPHPVREIELIPQEIPLNIVYEDDALIVINKQPGLVVHPGYGNYSGTLVNGLIHHFRSLPKNRQHGVDRPGLIHRLDKLTSGIMVVAKTEEAMTDLALQFFERTTERRYHALVWGDIESDGSIEGHIGRSPKNRKVMEVFPDGDYGKPAKTHYKVLKRFGYVSLVECKLETGRTHQIRVHMKHLGHPLFNDPEYGGDRILKGTSFSRYRQFVENCFELCPRQALHAKSLGFKHPETGKWMQFDSELPEDMASVIDKWAKYVAGREL
jgi:23S rRNA pseudouridine1911/1915/1917 synthase